MSVGYPPIAGRFAGRTVVVAGAASGIGLATARRFWAEGASVVCVDRNGGALRELAQSSDLHVDV